MHLVKGTVTYYARANGDKSLTFYARWETWNDERTQTFKGHERLFRTEPKPKWRSLRNHKAKARQECNAIYHRLRYPDERRTIRALATLDAVKLYMMWARATNSDYPAPMAESTANRQEQVLMDFINWAADHKPCVRRCCTLTTEHTFNWVKHKIEAGLNPRTVLTYLSDLQSWLDFCADNNWSERPPTLKRLRRSLSARIRTEPAKHIPSTEEVNKAIKDQDDYLMRAAVFTLAATGLRSGELRALIRSNVDLWAKVIKVNPSEREGFATATKRHERIMPYGEVLGGILETIMPTRTGPWLFGPTEGYKQLGSQLNHRLKRLNLKPHDLRRWFNTTLENMEVEQYVIDDLMGHKRSKLRQAYSDGTEIEVRRKWMVKVEENLAWPD